MVRDGEPFTPAVVFFPMHRIERVELDLPDRKSALAVATISDQDRAEPSVVRPVCPTIADHDIARLEGACVKLSQIFTAPNQLTLLRMIFVPFIVIHLVDGHYLWALAVFS